MVPVLVGFPSLPAFCSNLETSGIGGSFEGDFPAHKIACPGMLTY